MRQVDMGSPAAMAEYRRLNPNASFPTLRDQDLVLWESNAICLYLAAQSEHLDLGGRSREAVAAVHQWLFWELAHFAPGVLKLVNHELGLSTASREKEEGLWAEVHRLFELLDAQLDDNAFVTGDQPRVPDFAIASDLSFAPEVSLPLRKYPQLAAWFEQICQRSSWQTTEALKNAALSADIDDAD